MKYILMILMMTAPAFAESPSITVKLGEASSKKSLLAMPPLQYLGAPAASSNYHKVGAELFNVITNDLTVSSYFQIMPQSSFIEDTAKTGLRPQPADPKGFRFQSWSRSYLKRASSGAA